MVLDCLSGLNLPSWATKTIKPSVLSSLIYTNHLTRLIPLDPLFVLFLISISISMVRLFANSLDQPETHSFLTHFEQHVEQWVSLIKKHGSVKFTKYQKGTRARRKSRHQKAGPITIESKLMIDRLIVVVLFCVQLLLTITKPEGGITSRIKTRTMASR